MYSKVAKYLIFVILISHLIHKIAVLSIANSKLN